jgi:RNA polymerase sigma-70 factor (ECF subfamily)
VDERQLRTRVIEGDAAAERTLYDRHVDDVFRLAYRMCGDEAMAEELTQDTFLRAFDRIGDWRADAPFGAWLRAVSVSVVLNGMRRARRTRDRETLVADADSLGRSVPPPDVDLGRVLAAAVEALPEDHRLVFVMHEMEGYTHREIADALGTRVGTAKARLSRARTKLKNLLTGVLAGPNLESEA